VLPGDPEVFEPVQGSSTFSERSERPAEQVVEPVQGSSTFSERSERPAEQVVEPLPMESAGVRVGRTGRRELAVVRRVRLEKGSDPGSECDVLACGAPDRNERIGSHPASSVPYAD
jgi:hypothetical protein